MDFAPDYCQVDVGGGAPGYCGECVLGVAVLDVFVYAEGNDLLGVGQIAETIIDHAGQSRNHFSRLVVTGIHQ